MSVVHGLRHATESEVVLAFLRGEMDSQRFGSDVRQALVEAGGLDLVHSPDLDSEEENRARERALSAARGWRTNTGLFTGFPETVEWYHGPLPPDELSRVRFIDYSYWIELSGGSCRPGDVPSTLRYTLAVGSVEIVAEMASDERYGVLVFDGFGEPGGKGLCGKAAAVQRGEVDEHPGGRLQDGVIFVGSFEGAGSDSCTELGQHCVDVLGERANDVVELHDKVCLYLALRLDQKTFADYCQELRCGGFALLKPEAVRGFESNDGRGVVG